MYQGEHSQQCYLQALQGLGEVEHAFESVWTAGPHRGSTHSWEWSLRKAQACVACLASVFGIVLSWQTTWPSTQITEWCRAAGQHHNTLTILCCQQWPVVGHSAGAGSGVAQMCANANATRNSHIARHHAIQSWCVLQANWMRCTMYRLSAFVQRQVYMLRLHHTGSWRGLQASPQRAWI